MEPRLLVALVRLLTFAGIALAAMQARAATRLHALVIGNNSVPLDAEAGRDPTLAPLKYADDDATAVASFIRQIATSVHLLTVMDAATQALYPRLVSGARAPSRAAVEAAVAELSGHLARDRARGDESVVLVFFSGHGSISPRGEPALALLDGGLNRDFLYDRVLSRLPARYMHLVVDACHAESVVRPRDSGVEAVNITPAAAAALLARTTLARFPNVGAILASSHGAQAHEWDAVGHGIFTHQLLSALRGAADVNGDRRLEYSEVYAFMSAANRRVSDARARLSIVARPPPSNRRAPLVDLARFPLDRNGWLTGLSGEHGAIRITDELGRRLATLHNSPDLSNALLLPSGTAMFVTADTVEAELSLQPGRGVRFTDLAFVPTTSRSRGEIAAAFRRGLFATPFGRGYYEGFTDNDPELGVVGFSEVPRRDGAASPNRASSDWRWRLGVGGGLSTATADVLGVSRGVQAGLARSDSHGPSATAELFGAGDGPLREWRATIQGGYLWQTAPRAVRGHVGARAGGGVIVQLVEGQATRSSPVAVAGPVVGVATRIGGGLGMYSEVEVAVQLAEVDGRAVFTAAPFALLGATWEPGHAE